jgi:hypothetical protein
MYHLYYSLSKKIKEDVKIREEIEVKLRMYADRIRDVMDAITSTFFSKEVDDKKVEDMVFSLEADESVWSALRKKDWFLLMKQMAERNGFFHMELEFPFLLNNAFDFIFVQPDLIYSWEDEMPLGEVTKAYIKKGMPFLKSDGKMIAFLDRGVEDVVHDLQGSKKYDVDAKKGFLVLTKKHSHR